MIGAECRIFGMHANAVAKVPFNKELWSYGLHLFCPSEACMQDLGNIHGVRKVCVCAEVKRGIDLLIGSFAPLRNSVLKPFS